MLDQLGAQVRRLREAQALTLRELADRSGISQRFLASLERGQTNISVLKLADVARALGTTAAVLLSESPRATLDAASTSRWIALLGLRGAGKSAIGSRTAERLGLPFVELDALIAEKAGMSLQALFTLHGNDYYRRLELAALEELLESPRRGIVATGGGIVTHHAGFERLRANAVTVFLKAKAEDHWDRVVAQGDARPMANRSGAMQELRAILRARRALYEQADHLVDTSSLGLARSVDAVVRLTRPLLTA